MQKETNCNLVESSVILWENKFGEDKVRGEEKRDVEEASTIREY
jgi:hypothetical protein